jgi:hypothetical protein
MRFWPTFRIQYAVPCTFVKQLARIQYAGPHTVCGNFGSLPLGGKKGKPHPGIKAKSASRMPRAGDDRIRYAVILEVYYDIFWRAWPPLQCAVGVAAEHTGAWVPRHITNPVLLLTPRSESEHMCVCVCVEIYITHS